MGLPTGGKRAQGEAHQRLQALVGRALATQADRGTACANAPMGRQWSFITELVLNAEPNDPVSLACVAKVKPAHGHTDFAVTYLQYATRSIHAKHSRNPGA